MGTDNDGAKSVNINRAVYVSWPGAGGYRENHPRFKQFLPENTGKHSMFWRPNRHFYRNWCSMGHYCYQGSLLGAHLLFGSADICDKFMMEATH